MHTQWQPYCVMVHKLLAGDNAGSSHGMVGRAAWYHVCRHEVANQATEGQLS